MTNLDQNYVEFIDEGGSVGELVQEVIDRMQYNPGFLEELQGLIKGYESPFERIINDEGQFRVLKEKFRNTKTGLP